MQPKATIAKNTTWFTTSLIIQKVLSFIYFWFISNNLFPGDLGKYVFALSFTTLFSIFIDLGLSPVLTREAAKNLDRANKYLKNVLAIKLPLAVLTVLTAIFVINITGKPVEVKLLVYLACIIMTLDSFTLSFYAIFRSAQNLKYESIGTVIFQIINFTLGVITLKLTGQVKYIMMALVTASSFNFFYSLSLLKLKLKFLLKPQWSQQIIKYLLKIVPAFALAGIFIKIYNTSDSVLLSYLADDIAVGYFAVPAKVIFALQMIIPGSFAAVIFPAFSHFYATSKEELRKTFVNSMFYLMIVSIPMSLGLLSLIPEVISVFWPAYSAVIPTFQVMTLAIPFIFMGFATGSLLNACDRQKNNTINRGTITFLAIVLNILLIPFYAQLGAGITFLVSNVVLLILDLYWVAKTIDYDKVYLIKSLVKSLIAGLVMAMGVVLLKDHLHLLLVAPIGALIYFLILYLVRGFTIRDIKTVLKSTSTRL